MLPCLHSFCLQCLHHEIEKSGSQQAFKCPTCAQNTSIPSGGASVLPQDLRLGFEVEVAGYVSKIVSGNEVCCDHCIEVNGGPAVVFCCTCCQFLCKPCHKYHKRGRQQSSHIMIGLDLEGAKLLQATMKPHEKSCTLHNLVLDVYCETCKFLCCPRCILVDHKDHAWCNLVNVAVSHRDEMNSALNATNEVVTKLTGAIEGNDKKLVKLEISKRSGIVAIDSMFEMLQQTLQKRKEALLTELEAMSLSKTTALSLQKEQFEKTLENIGRYTCVVSRILQTYTDQELVALEGLGPTELKATLKMVDNMFLLPVQHSDISVSLQKSGFLREVLKIGNILEYSPSSSESSLISSSIAKEKTRFRAKLETKATNGGSYPYGGLEVKAELIDKSHDGPVISGEVEDHGDGTYTITLTPRIAGPHQLVVTMDDGQHVQNSPHNLDVRPKCDYRTLCTAAQQVIKCDLPLCVAVHDNGNIYVGSDTKCIYVFKQSGERMKAIGPFGRPTDITIKRNMLYVADQDNSCVQKLTAEGRFLQTIGEKGLGPGQLMQPVAVVVDSSDRLIVSDFETHHVQIFNQNGDYLFTIDGNGRAKNAFQQPWGLCLDLYGNIHVAVHGSNSVNVFTKEGVYVRMLDDLMGPSGIAVDDEGYSIVSEYGGNCFSIFDPQGNKIHMLGNLNYPFGLVLDPSGSVLYIADHHANSVLKYST